MISNKLEFRNLWNREGFTIIKNLFQDLYLHLLRTEVFCYSTVWALVKH